jgi:hypothetical protein
LLLLAMAGGVGFAIWNFSRKAAERKAASEARFEKMFKGREQALAEPQPPVAAVGDPPAPAKAPAAAPAAPPVATQRFLGKAESLIYYFLKAGLPDLEVFASVSLARVLAATGNGRERAEQQRRLSQYQLDFVVCDKNMRLVAVVEVESAAGAEAAGDQRLKSDLLKQAGVRLVRISPAELPRRDQVRALIDGAPVQQDR